MFLVPPPPQQSPGSFATPSVPLQSTRRSSKFSKLSWKDPVDSVYQVLTEHEWFWTVAAALLVWEVCLTSAVVLKVPYTEIDFKTYLQQAAVFLSGERDYSLIKGDSGPCVYPAGHLYAYSLLNYVTDSGRHLERAQWLFAGLYVATLALVLGLYSCSRRVPPYTLIFLTVSKRIHSLYVLRLFNDCIAMFFLYAALWMYTRDTRDKTGRDGRWILGTCLFSLALSIKMSILLFLPALFYILFVYHSPVALLRHSFVLVSTQLLLAAPFLKSSDLAKAYFAGAFDFKREFLWEWTVNWRWVGVEVFEDPAWGKILLMVHAAGLGALAIRWSEEEGGVLGLLRRAWKTPSSSPARHALTSTRIVSLFFTSNLLGILCARSLHYQFYVWFYHSLVWLLWDAWDGLGIEAMQKLVFISLIEYGFFAFPSTVNSSLGLVLSLLIVLVVAWYGRPAGDRGDPVGDDAAEKKTQ